MWHGSMAITDGIEEPQQHHNSLKLTAAVAMHGKEPPPPTPTLDLLPSVGGWGGWVYGGEEVWGGVT